MPIPLSLTFFLLSILGLVGLGAWSFRARLLSWPDFRSMLICACAILVLLPSVPHSTIPDEEGEVSAQEAQLAAEQMALITNTSESPTPKPKTWYQLAKMGKFPRITILDGDTSTEFQVQTITSTTTSIVPIGMYTPDTTQMDNNPPSTEAVLVPVRRKR